MRAAGSMLGTAALGEVIQAVRVSAAAIAAVLIDNALPAKDRDRGKRG
ncbi:hypothetical protein ACRAWF_25275 [Streptomyces sp. L7]